MGSIHLSETLSTNVSLSLTITLTIASLLPYGAHSRERTVRACHSMQSPSSVRIQAPGRKIASSRDNFDEERIPNGIETQGFDKVVELTINGGTCTGTLIGKGTLLTAAHCFDCVQGVIGRKDVHFQFRGRYIRGSKILCHSKYDNRPDRSYRLVQHDFAIVFFDPNSIREDLRYPQLSSTPPRTQELITLVGFGANDWEALLFNGAGTKRYGTTRIEHVDEDDIASIRGYATTPGVTWYDWTGSPNGEDVAASFGDSGGPMLSTSNVVYAIAHGGDILRREQDSRRLLVYYPLVSGKSAREFLSQARTAGADFRFTHERR